MEFSTVINNSPSQSYGQDVSMPVHPGNLVKALVERKLGENMYLLSINKRTFEAQIMADLEEGMEYQFTVDKGGNPPRLSPAQKQGNQPARDGSALSAEENRWLDSFLGKGNLPAERSNRIMLLSFLRSMHCDIDQQPAEVYAKVKDMLALLEKIDASSPALRQALGKTLLYNMEGLQLDFGEKDGGARALLEKVVLLSGEIPDWSTEDLAVLKDLLARMGGLGREDRQQIQAMLLGLAKGGQSDAELKEWLVALLLAMKGGSGASEGALHEWAAACADKILSDMTARLFLSSGLFKDLALKEEALPGGLDRQSAVASFLRQMPGLQGGSALASLLNQFVSLGGRLDRLSLGDALGVQDAWRGSTPSAMLLHRSGTLLFLSQMLPEESRDFSNSALLGREVPAKFPIFLTPKASLDPASTTLSISRLQEFTSSAKLPNTLYIDRLLKNWVQDGNLLSELRPQLRGIQAWNILLQTQPESRSQITEYLLHPPIFQKGDAAAAAQQASVNAAVLPETRQMLLDALQKNGIQQGQVPAKYLASVLSSLQAAAGEGATPDGLMVSTAAWLISRNVELSPSMLSALNSFQRGEGAMSGLLPSLGQLRALMAGLPADLAEALGRSLLSPTGDGSALRNTMSFYQVGNGARLLEVLEQILQDYAGSGRTQNLLISLIQSVRAGQESLEGLKYYNLQASRGELPQLFEIPVAFGDSQQSALLRVFRRQQGKSGQAKDDTHKVVVDLNMEALGRVRAELTLRNKQLQLDFLTPREDGMAELKKYAGVLADKLSGHDLKPALSFRLKKVAEDDGTIPLFSSVTVEKPQFKVDLSA